MGGGIYLKCAIKRSGILVLGGIIWFFITFFGILPLIEGIYQKHFGADSVYSREQRAERMCLHIHSATAARVEYPAAQLRYKFDAPSACCGVFD